MKKQTEKIIDILVQALENKKRNFSQLENADDVSGFDSGAKRRKLNDDEFRQKVRKIVDERLLELGLVGKISKVDNHELQENRETAVSSNQIIS